MIYILSLLLALSFCMYQRSQFKDLMRVRNTQWKLWRNVIIGLVFSYSLVPCKYHPSYVDVFGAASLFWLLFELGTNKISLNKDWFHVGDSSSKFDTIFKGMKWYVTLLPVIISIILKTKTMQTTIWVSLAFCAIVTIGSISYSKKNFGKLDWAFVLKFAMPAFLIPFLMGYFFQ